MSKIKPLPKITKLSLIRGFLYYKRIIRLQLHLLNCYSDRIASLGRNKRLLEAQKNPFDRYRINQAEQNIASLCEQRKQARVDLTGSGQLLKGLMPYADRILSFHDKCQLLNLNHTAALKALSSDKTISFEKMIFVYALEYRGKEEILPIDDISMPYWCVMHHRFIYEMETNQKLRMATDIVFEEILSEARQIQDLEKKDGTRKMRQVALNLRVVK